MLKYFETNVINTLFLNRSIVGTKVFTSIAIETFIKILRPFLCYEIFNIVHFIKFIQTNYSLYT